MLLKIYLLSWLTLLATADNSIEYEPQSVNAPTETRVEHSVSFETSHKRPKALEDDAFQTSHKVGFHSSPDEQENDADFRNLKSTMNLLPTKERPELNPVLSALINEDVMKSIEAKRAIEQEELEYIKAEADAALAAAEDSMAAKTAAEINAAEEIQETTEVPIGFLTTTGPIKKVDLNGDINMDFVDQTINLDVAGSENNKKSRIEIKKGPNGQDYEYEYVYYYEDEDEADDSKAKASEAVEEKDATARGKSRYTNIDRSTTATPVDNSLVSGRAKGRSSSAAANNAADIEPERLPANTRFPSRGKNVEVQPTPALDSLENAAEKKKISVKRPSLELVDSDTFNTDEKQAKSARNGDSETKPVIAIEQERAAAAAAAIESADKAAAEKTSSSDADDENSATEKIDSVADETTPTMEKAALDLYAILANENFNMDLTTDVDMEATTLLPDTTNADGEEGLTTLIQEEPSSSTTSTSTTTTTTEAPTTTTTTTTTAPPLYGGRKAGPVAAGRNRFKLKQGGATSATASTTTEAPAVSEPTKAVRNRFSRPSVGGRNRPSFRTTAAPSTAAAPAAEAEEEEVAVKDVKPVSSGFGRGRPRNRFNLRGSTTTTEKPAVESEEGAQEEVVSSTTARTLRGRPGLNLRSRSRTTTTKAPASEDEEQAHNEAASNEEKPATPVQRPSRFNANRAGGNRLLPRTKFGRTTEAPSSEDSAADSSHHNDVKGDDDGDGEKSEVDTTQGVQHAAGGLNRLKSRPQLNNLHKTESAKPKTAPAALAPRKVNPLLSRRRLQLGSSTTEVAPAEDEVSAPPEPTEQKSDSEATVEADADSAKDETTEEAETTTKQQARGLGLLGQRRRLPLRKPGTIL